jgi:hypothetical protein
LIKRNKTNDRCKDVYTLLCLAHLFLSVLSKWLVYDREGQQIDRNSSQFCLSSRKIGLKWLMLIVLEFHKQARGCKMVMIWQVVHPWLYNFYLYFYNSNISSRQYMSFFKKWEIMKVIEIVLLSSEYSCFKSTEHKKK